MEWTGDDRLPPRSSTRLGEAAWLLPRLLARSSVRRETARARRRPPALVIPGFVAHDRTTVALRRALADAGWRVHGWNMGWNWGASADTSTGSRRGSTRSATDGPVLVVGWSLGGLFARELAPRRPERVRAVVTLGSPFSGDPQAEQCLAAVRTGRRPQGRRSADPAHHRQAAGAAPRLLVAARRPDRAARGAGPGRTSATRKSSSTARHMAFGVSRRAADNVVREIDRFLKKHG